MIDQSKPVQLLEDLPSSCKEEEAIYIVSSRFNKGITTRLINGCIQAAKQHQFPIRKLPLVWVPGSLELAQCAKQIITYKKPAAIICLGAVIKGDTAHFEHVCTQSAQHITALNTQYEIPVIMGVLTTYDSKQALDRAKDTPDHNNGYAAFESALEMIKTLEKLKKK